MKYIIMCGGTYNHFKEPRQFIKILGERIIDRTIRLLKENNVDNNDIYISTNDDRFSTCGVVLLTDDNNDFVHETPDEYMDKGPIINRHGYWLDAFYPTDEPCCYLFGDVFYSEDCMEKIVNAQVDEFLFVGTDVENKLMNYNTKSCDEPLAFIVYNQEAFKEAIRNLKSLWDNHKLCRHPIAWEVYRYLCNYPLNQHIIGKNYLPIYDYTTDIDLIEQVPAIEKYFQTIQYNRDNNINVIGIISWFPNDERRETRKERLTSLLYSIGKLFPTTDIIIIAQNWKNYTIPSIQNNVKIYNYNEALGILNARKILRTKFLEFGYNYLIMMDDDVKIIGTVSDSKKYLQNLNDHKDGFLFLRFDFLQLSLCAISRYIYEKEPMVDMDVCKGQGNEDEIFSKLLHKKYSEREFTINSPIKCEVYSESMSTWIKEIPSDVKAKGRQYMKLILDYLEANNDLPNLQILFEFGDVVPKNSSYSYYCKKAEEMRMLKKKEEIDAIVYKIKNAKAREIYRKAMYKASNIIITNEEE